jgi:hypothetical protein
MLATVNVPCEPEVETSCVMGFLTTIFLTASSRSGSEARLVRCGQYMIMLIEEALFLPFFWWYDLDNPRFHTIFVYLVYVLFEVLEMFHGLTYVSAKGIFKLRHFG